jgi:hypothetical protein
MNNNGAALVGILSKLLVIEMTIPDSNDPIPESFLARADEVIE